ncbi:MAG: aldehyde ferredoxin oxidoreductase N-terminal domain-containing protein, partial [Dehalococcoidales bacterium]
MANGYMGKILFVDLAKKSCQEETLSEAMCRDFMGGYGIAARILYERMKPGVDPLGPDNMLGFMTGPLTGTPTMCSGRFVVVAKSPLTGTWGDANCGGDFGPFLKFAGFDGVFFTGNSVGPVYLFIDNGKPELRDAADLWGKDCLETEDILKNAHGKDTSVACIGPSGEKLSLIAAIMNEKGRAAGRSGLGAVMGAKKLKAVAVRGNQRVPMANEDKAKELRRKYLTQLKGQG